MPRKLTPVAIILMVLGIWQLWQQAPTLAAVSSDQWGMTDWLVNYEGGFVRRGLGGFLLLVVSQSHGVLSAGFFVFLRSFGISHLSIHNCSQRLHFVTLTHCMPDHFAWWMEIMDSVECR